MWSVALCHLSHPLVFFSVCSNKPDGVIAMFPSCFYGDKEWAVSCVVYVSPLSLTHTFKHAHICSCCDKSLKYEMCKLRVCLLPTVNKLNVHTNKFDATLWLGISPSGPKSQASILNLTLHAYLFPKPLNSNLSSFPAFFTFRPWSRRWSSIARPLKASWQNCFMPVLLCHLTTSDMFWSCTCLFIHVNLSILFYRIYWTFLVVSKHLNG